MSLAGPITVLLVVGILAGCAQPKITSGSVLPVLQHVASVDVNMNHYPSYAEYHKRVYARINDVVHQLTSASDLKALFLECHRLWRNAPEQPQEKLQWINPHSEACNAILFRLAELDRDDATRVLVELYGDEAFSWDGAFSLNAANAISRCGKRALPYLGSNTLGTRIPHAKEIARCIEEGQRYGP